MYAMLLHDVDTVEEDGQFKNARKSNGLELNTEQGYHKENSMSKQQEMTSELQIAAPSRRTRSWFSFRFALAFA
jgi:hypothetical protein